MLIKTLKVDFGGDDQRNPANFLTVKKWIITAIVCLFTLITCTCSLGCLRRLAPYVLLSIDCIIIQYGVLFNDKRPQLFSTSSDSRSQRVPSGVRRRTPNHCLVLGRVWAPAAVYWICYWLCVIWAHGRTVRLLPFRIQREL